MRISDDERRQMIANRPTVEGPIGDSPARSLPAPAFAPLGYVTHEHVLEAVGKHLFPSMSDAEAASMSDAETMQAIRKCLHHLRQLLFARKLDAFTSSVYSDPPFHVIENSFWLRDEADRALATGKHESLFESATGIYFKEGAIENSLRDDSEAGKPENMGGRPSIQPAVRAAYWQIYPQGHGVAGDGWKAVAAKVGEQIGQSVSDDTVQRAVKG